MLKEILFLVIAICHLTYAVVHPPFVAGYKRTAKIYPHLPPVYDINLDLDYEDRWRELMTGKRDLVLRMYNLMTSQIDLPLEIIHSVNYTVLEAHDVEYAKELLAISKLLSFSFEQTLLLSTFFDLVPRCTTFIIQDADNNVYQGRDADQFYADILEPMMYHARFFKNGKLLYQTVSKLAELGSLAGLRQNSYALNLNQYLVPFYYTGSKNGYEVIPEQIQRIYGEYLKSYADSLLPPQTNHLKKPPKMTRTGALMLARRVLETCETYEEAVEMIKKGPISSKAFYIVSGTESGQGAVIARSGDEVHHEAYLNPDEGIWYLVQDNYRRDISDPSHDNRRVAGEYELEKIGRDKITKDLVWTNLLEKYPLLSNVTLHSTITDPKTGEFKTIMWGWSKDEIKQWNSKKNVRLW